MTQKTVGLSLRAAILALALILVAGSPALPPFDGVAYAQSAAPELTATKTPGGGSVSLSWTAVADADSYEVWKGIGRGDSVVWASSALKTVTAPATTYADTDVTAGSTYSYAVRAVDGDTMGSFSNVPNVTITAGTAAPTAATTVTAAGSGLTAIDVSWPGVAGATGYHVQYWEESLDNWTRLDDQTGTSFTHSGLTPGTRYFYVVRAVNSGGNGPWSDYTSYTLEATTSKPVLTLTHVSREVVRLTWTATSLTATYNLERQKTVTSDGSGGTWETLTLSATDQSSRSYTDNNAAYDTTTNTASNPPGVTMYHYRVQGIDSEGSAGDPSDVKKVTVPSSGVRPAAPSDLSAPAGTITANSIRLTWTATASTSSEIRWKTGSQAYSSPMAESSPYDHTGLSASTQYTYQVRARNINGPSGWSAEVNARTSATPSVDGQMGKVTGLTVMDATTTVVDTTTNKIKLSWNAVSNATHYDIQRWNTGAALPTWEPLTHSDAPAGRITVATAKSPPSIEDTDVTAGVTYYYVVSAVVQLGDTADADNDDMGAWSDAKSDTVKETPPGDTAPANLTLTVTGPNSIWLSWDSVAAATKYTIQWREGGATAQQRTIDAMGRTTHHHTGLSSNTLYYYQVRAENSSGMTLWTAEMEVRTWVSQLATPSGVMVVDATDASPSIKVSWTEVPGATGYQLQKWSGGAWGDVGTLSAGATTIMTEQTEENLAAATTYYYRVRAVNASDMSKWSEVESGTTKHGVTPAPTLRATSTGMSMIRLSWSAVDGATSYILESFEGAKTATQFETNLVGRMTMTLNGNLMHHVHTDLDPGTRYSYRLQAVLPQGVKSGWQTTSVQQYTKPAKAELTATGATDTTMMLKWDAVSFMAADGMAGRLTDDAHYTVQRRLSNGGPWEVVSLTGAAVCGDPPTNKCEFEDTGLTASTPYRYRIRATVTRTDTYKSYWGYANQRTVAASN